MTGRMGFEMDIIFDVDGTLMNVDHRRKFVDGSQKKDWKAFVEAIHLDTPIWPVVHLALGMQDQHTIIVVSGRNEAQRDITEKQLNALGIQYDTLRMRPDGDYEPDYVVKEIILDGLIEDGFSPEMAFDDRPSVCAMWRKRGLTCFQLDGDITPYGDVRSDFK